MTDQFTDSCHALGICLIANIPVLLWGPPGTGKTSTIEGLADDLGMHVETVIASIYSPSEFAGLPFIDDTTKTVALYPPSWAKRAADAATEHGSAVVFYDEISTAPEAVQAALLRPILSGWVGDLKLPTSVRTVAAANPPEQAAGGWDLSPPAANRFIHLNWTLPASVVRDGFAGRWPKIPIRPINPDDAKKNRAHIKRIIAAFLSARPDLICVIPTTSEEAGRAFPTPRSWDMLAAVYAVAEAADATVGTIDTLVRGTIGDAAANEFIHYISKLDLPDPETLLTNPTTWTPPHNRADIVYAVCAAIDSALTENNTGNRWPNAGHILAAVVDAGHADVAVLYGNKWLDHRPAQMMPERHVMEKLTPILQSMRLLHQPE